MKLVLGAVVAALVGASVVVAPVAYALIMPSVLSLGVMALVLRWVETADPLDQEVARWTYGSYALHLVLSMVTGASSLTRLFFGTDADVYHDNAVAIVGHWSDGSVMPAIPAGKEGFYFALAMVYRVVGPYRVGGFALTALSSALIVPLLADTTRRLFGRPAVRALLPLVVLLPGLLVWTAQLLKEAPILAALALGANLAVRLSERFSALALVVLGLDVGALLTLRANVAYVFAIGLLVGLALGGRHLIAGVATAAAMIGLMAMIVLVGGLGESGYQYSTAADLKQVNVVRSDLASSDSGIAPDADVSTTSGSLAYLATGLPQFVLSPFPWQVQNLRQAFGLLEAMTIWYLVPSLVRGIRLAARRVGRKAALLLVPAGGLTVVLTLLLGNIGTLVRERIQVVILVLPFVALGWARTMDDDDEAGLTGAAECSLPVLKAG